MNPPDLDTYLHLLGLYRPQLREALPPRGERLALPFARVVQLLCERSEFNRTLPAPFLEAARSVTEREPSALSHFSFDENRQFFLSDLYDWLQLQARRRPEGGAGAS